MLTRSTRATSAMRCTTVKRMPRKSRFEASACVSSSTSRRVLLLLGERLDDAAHAELAADARDELDRLEGLAHEVVGPRLEGPGDLVVGVERGQHDDRQVARLRRGRAGCAGSGSRRAAASPDRAARARAEPLSICSSASAPDPTATCGSSAFASAWIRTCRLTVSSSTTRTGPPGTYKSVPAGWDRANRSSRFPKKPLCRTPTARSVGFGWVLADVCSPSQLRHSLLLLEQALLLPFSLPQAPPLRAGGDRPRASYALRLATRPRGVRPT